MPSIYTETVINAPKKQVWHALFHKEEWLKWNTFLFDSDPARPFQLGREVILSLRRIRREEETEFGALVTLLQLNTCLSWVSTTTGFRTEYIFELQEIGVGRTKYMHQAKFSGWLSGIFLPFIRLDEQRAMERMARELKHYVEGF